MADILVYSEKRDTALELTYQAKEFAGALGLGVSAVAFGPTSGEVAPELAALGADTVYVSDDPALEGLQTDVVAEALAQVAGAAEATCVLVGSTRRGKELASRLAQKLGAGCVTDVAAWLWRTACWWPAGTPSVATPWPGRMSPLPSKSSP